ncbi:MerR family transcriptional regulator [Metabacillus sp. RGM 3146]|uniref:MerR family transcriptional regulator n=1 Tax=Metabacillus sp. RGM 3146 TaxID=3401092 RepID=UPI003B9D8CD8
MNTSMAAKHLGVSSKTIQRWVKQLDLPMERNELGHYLFEEKDIETLKKVQEQLNSGILLQDIAIEKKQAVRKGTASLSMPPEEITDIMERLKRLEKKMNDKADAVVSYQLLQHRREMEELTNRVKKIEQNLEQLSSVLSGTSHDENPFNLDIMKDKEKSEKKGIWKAIFSF